MAENLITRLARKFSPIPQSDEGGWNERLPDGTPMMDIGIPAWQRVNPITRFGAPVPPAEGETPALLRPVGVPEAAPAMPALEPLRRTIQPLAPVPPAYVPVPGSAEDPMAPMIRYNNKARPIGVEGGDPLTRDKALLTAQENYKAPHSTKDLLKRLALGFLNGGIPGAIGGGLNYELDQNVRNQDAVGGDMAITRDRIGQEMLRRKTENDWLNDATDRDYKTAQATNLRRLPERELATQSEQARDNIRQLYNSQPFFDAEKNPQHKAMAERAEQLGIILPNRAEKDNWSLEKVNGVLKRVNKTTGEVIDTGLVNDIDVPVVEDGLTVTPGTALGARATRENRDFTRGEKQSENATKREAKLNESASLYKKAEALDAEAKKLEGQADPYGDVAKRMADYAKEARELRTAGDRARSDGEAIPVNAPLTRGGAGGGGKHSEADVRARAKALGKDPDAAVAKVKAAGLLR